MNKNTILITIIFTAFLIIGILSYIGIDSNQIATHWDQDGNVNGYMSKFWGIFLLPFISLGLLLIFLAIPKIDPLKSNIKKFKKQYDSFVTITMLFMLYIYASIIVYNLGYPININKTIIPAIALLFIYLGSIMKEIRKNWFIGIRTPWTLSSDHVWKKTHELGSILFTISGLIILTGILLPTKYILPIILVPAITISLGLMIYSWWIYKKETKS